MQRKFWTGFLCVLCSLLPASVSLAGLTQDIREVNRTFTYRAQPIHPNLLREFSTLVLDHTNSITVSVDIKTGMGTNEYPDNNVYVTRAGLVCSRNPGSIFCYHWLGRLKNGLHVVNVGESGDNSWRHGEVFFIRVGPGRGYTSEGDLYGRVLMTIVRSYPLKEDFSGNIRLDGDQVIIEESGEDAGKDIVLTCPAR